MALNVTFVVPPDAGSLSSAAIYNRQMIAALRTAGHRIAIAVHPEPTDRLVIDAILLAEIPAETLASPNTAVMVHHLPPLLRHSKIAATFARIVTTNALTAARLTDECGAEPARIAVVAPGNATFARSPGSGGPGCAILSIGGWLERKDHDVLVRALARLPDLAWSLTIVGSDDPAQAETINALARTLEIGERVRSLAGADPATLEALWQGADLFALASRWEGYGIAVAEALRRGLPAVVSDGGAAGDLVPAEAGAVCPAGDPVAFSKALRRMIFDVDLRRMMADSAFEAGQTLPSWQDQAAHFAAALA